MTFLRLQWDRAGAALAVLVGAVALLIGWIGVSGTGLVSAQLPYYLSGGLVGIFCLAIGATLWLSADLRDEWRELRELRLLLSADLEASALGGTRAADDALDLTGPLPPFVAAAREPERVAALPSRSRRAAAAK